MAFEGCEFSFDGRPSHDYGLVIYNFASYEQDDTFSFPSAGKIQSDRIPFRTSSLLYAVIEEDVAEFTLVFGARPESFDERDPIDRWEQESIASWLTGKGGYRWLEIDQDDMHTFRFRCVITELEAISVGGEQWAYRCKVTCDSPYAYMYPNATTYTVSGPSQPIIFRNRSTKNDDYYPLLRLKMSGGDSISITNQEFGEKLELTGLPGQTYTINIDNENQVISSEELPDFNFYEHFNFTFLRLKRGLNRLTFDGNGVVTIICNFPVNIGG